MVILEDIVLQPGRYYFGTDPSFISFQKLDAFREGSPLLLENDAMQKDSSSSILSVSTDPSFDLKHRRSSSRDQSSAISSVTESSQAGELISGLATGLRLPAVCFSGLALAIGLCNILLLSHLKKNSYICKPFVLFLGM